MTLDDLCLAWRQNNAINLRLLELCPDDTFELKPGSGKTIRSNFVHIVGVRKMWLEDRLKSEAAAIPKLDWKSATREEIIEGLAVSSAAMEKLFRAREERAKPGANPTICFFAYCVAHEAHHRSQIEIALRIAKREPEDLELYRLWEWGKVLDRMNEGP